MSKKSKRSIPNPNNKVKFENRPLIDIDVLYIHPAKQGNDFRPSENVGRPYGVIPVGLPALINMLRKNGFRVKGINVPLERQLNPTFSLKEWLKIRRTAKVILIDLHWYEHCYGSIEVAQLCKEILPQAKTIIGGLTASGFSKEIMENFPAVDFIIRGDAEKPLLMLVQEIKKASLQPASSLELAAIPNLSYRENGALVENELSYCASTEILDELNFTDMDFLEHHKEYFVHEYIVADIPAARKALETKPFWGRWLSTARGCKYSCSYCGGSKAAHKLLAGRQGLVTRSPQKMVEDLGKLSKMGVHQASLAYDIAELGEDYWREFFSRLRDSGIKIGIYNEFFQLPKPSFVEDYVRSVDMTQSCVAFSPLCGNERVRRLNGKHYTNDELFDVLDHFNEHHAYIFVYFSLNLPGMTDPIFEETVELARDVYEFYPSHLVKILNTTHTVDPYSPMAVAPQKYGIQVSMKTFMDFYNYCRDTQKIDPGARTGVQRGFQLEDSETQSLKRMADQWDRERNGREKSWWPIPPSW